LYALHMLRRQTSPEGAVYYQSTLLAAAGVAHAFSTRIGGVSRAPFDSLNLGNPNGFAKQDDLANIAENYRRLLAAIGLPEGTLLRVHQVHGPVVILDGNQANWDNSVCADAIVTRTPSRVASVRVADCVPVLLASSDGRVVAAVHAGWRGVIADVVPAALKHFSELKNIIAAIGPSIGMDNFEVGPEVLEEFSTAFASDAPIRRRSDGKGHVDLKAAIRLQLLHAGVDDSRIDVSDRCTTRDAAEFYSHRRDAGLTGRMAAVISPSAPPGSA
jgi:YfiH family protein